jgi:hypothetical protein
MFTGIDYDDKEGVGYPEVATKICELHALKEEISYSHALAKLKVLVGTITSWV